MEFKTQSERENNQARETSILYVRIYELDRNKKYIFLIFLF